MATVTTPIRTATSASRALPTGLHLARRRHIPGWLGAGAVIAGGLAMGAVAGGAPKEVVLAAAAIALVVGAVIYRAAVGLALLAFAYPFDLSTRLGPVKLTTSSALLVLVFLIWALRQFVGDPPARHRTPLDWPVALFAVATVVSLFSLLGPGADPDAQLVGLIKAAGGFLVFFLTVQSLEKRHDLWLVLGAILATGLIQAVATVIPAVTGTHPISEATRSTGTTVDANVFAGYLILIIPLLIAAGVVAFYHRRRWTLAAAGAATVIYGAALIATLSRGAWLGIVAGTVTLAVLLPRRRKPIAILAACVLVGFALAGFAGPIAARLGLSSDAATFLARVPIWVAALQMLVQHPAFGVGLHSFGAFVGSYNPHLHVSQAHNLFLNIAAELGIIGLAAFGIVVVVLFRTLARVRRNASSSRDRIVAAALVASFTAFFVHSLFDVSYYDYKILLLFWILVGAAATLPRLTRDEGTL